MMQHYTVICVSWTLFPEFLQTVITSSYGSLSTCCSVVLHGAPIMPHIYQKKNKKPFWGVVGLQANECSRRSVALRVLWAVRVGLRKDPYAHSPRCAHGAAACADACVKRARSLVLNHPAQRSLCQGSSFRSQCCFYSNSHTASVNGNRNICLHFRPSSHCANHWTCHRGWPWTYCRDFVAFAASLPHINYIYKLKLC